MFCLHTRMSFSDIPLLIHRVSYDISIPFTAITTLTLLGSLSTRLRSVYGNSDHSSRSVFMTLMLEEKAWLSVFTLIHPKAFYQVEIRTLQASSSTPNSSLSMSLWTLLGALVHSLLPQSWEHEVVWNQLLRNDSTP